MSAAGLSFSVASSSTPTGYCLNHHATSQNATVGFVCALIAVIFFGSNFVPVKKFETGDGVFFQWVLCSAISFVGMGVQLQQTYAAGGSPEFKPMAMLGGFLWCTGNIMSVPVIKCIGLSMGLLLWGGSNMVAGWASGTFGILGLPAPTTPLTTPWLNYLGVALSLASLGLYSFVETNVSGKKDGDASQEYAKLNAGDDYAALSSMSPRIVGSEYTMDAHGNVETPDVRVGMGNAAEGMSNSEDVHQQGSSWIDKLSRKNKRMVGIIGALVSGVFYGTSFNPVFHIIDTTSNPGDCHAIGFVFSHFSGIFLTSTIFMMIYCAATNNRPRIYPRVILPAFLSGIMWAIANTAWFIASENLSFSVSFPLVTTGPGFVSMFWGILVFNEVSGRKNFIILGIALTIAITGVLMIAVSK